jgi:hypothetical protein
LRKSVEFQPITMLSENRKALIAFQGDG